MTKKAFDKIAEGLREVHSIMRQKPKSKQVEAVAAAIGKRVGSQAGPWTVEYLPYVKWPDDYSAYERAWLRRAAEDAIAVLVKMGTLSMVPKRKRKRKREVKA